MKKSIYLYEAVLFLFIACYRFFLLKYMSGLADVFLVVFFIGSFFLMKNILGLRSDKSRIKTSAIQIVAIAIMLFIFIGYSSGLWFGFLKNSYSLKFLDILKNIYPLVFMITSQELIRFMVAKKSVKDSKPLVFLTLLYILMDFMLTFNSAAAASGLKMFVYFTNTFAPSVARHILCSYLSVHVGYMPGLILRLFFGLYVYILPIFPDYGYYIGSVVGVLLPYLIYLVLSKYVQYIELVKLPKINKGLWYVNIPLVVVMLFIVALVSGIFRYQVIAIGSGSMEPVYYKGDAVVFEKIKQEELSLVQAGHIICFEHAGKFVTHRVVEIVSEDGTIKYRTKGDNNKDNDDYLVSSEEIIGIVRLRIKSIGWPTIWFQELIS